MKKVFLDATVLVLHICYWTLVMQVGHKSNSETYSTYFDSLLKTL